MFDYESIFRKKQHYITIPQLKRRKLFVSNKLLYRLLDKQADDWDIFITKYPKDHCVSTVILDFDDKENPKNALKDVGKLRKYLNRKGLNTVIIQSGRKGYHSYLQIPCHNFTGGELAHADAEPNTFFKMYIKQLIGLYDGKEYPTLDEVNFNSGLGGNIRLIGSSHPKGTKCEIVYGEFLTDPVEPNEWDWDCFMVAKQYAEDKVTELVNATQINIGRNDLIANNDLQDVFEEVFGLTLKRYNGYSYARCPFHDDSHPSLFIDKEKFCCNSCSTRGNIYTLIKLGYLKLDNDLRVRKK